MLVLSCLAGLLVSLVGAMLSPVRFGPRQATGFREAQMALPQERSLPPALSGKSRARMDAASIGFVSSLTRQDTAPSKRAPRQTRTRKI
jgi:hypothetical protein